MLYSTAMKHLWLLLLIVLLAGCGTAATPTALPTPTPTTVLSSGLGASAMQTVQASKSGRHVKESEVLSNSQLLAPAEWIAYRRALIGEWLDSWDATVYAVTLKDHQYFLLADFGPNYTQKVWVADMPVSSDVAPLLNKGDPIKVSGVIEQLKEDEQSDMFLILWGYVDY